MKTYRFAVPALLYFEIEDAADEAEAKKRATHLVSRLEDGVELDNVDTEDELRAAIAYPAEGEPEIVNVVDAEESTAECLGTEAENTPAGMGEA